MLLPPSNADSHAGLAKEFCDRRASGATSFLTISEDLFAAAQDDGMVESGPPIKEGGQADRGQTNVFREDHMHAVVVLYPV